MTVANRVGEAERDLRAAEERLRLVVETPSGVLTRGELRAFLERDLADLERRAAARFALADADDPPDVSAPLRPDLEQSARRLRNQHSALRAEMLRLLFQARRSDDPASLKRPVLKLLDRLARHHEGEFRFAEREVLEDLGSAG